MENINTVLINDGVPQSERLVKLNQIAIQQMQVLEGNDNRNYKIILSLKPLTILLVFSISIYNFIAKSRNGCVDIPTIAKPAS